VTLAPSAYPATKLSPEALADLARIIPWSVTFEVAGAPAPLPGYRLRRDDEARFIALMLAHDPDVRITLTDLSGTTTIVQRNP
jgi:hypothetical protein